MENYRFKLKAGGERIAASFGRKILGDCWNGEILVILLFELFLDINSRDFTLDSPKTRNIQ